VHPYFKTCDSPLHASLSFTISLQKLHAHFHTCPFMLIHELLWHSSCTNIVIPKILMDNRICRSTADVQLFSCITDSNTSVLLNQSINSLNIVCHCEVVGQPKQPSSVTLVLPLWNFSTHWYPVLCIVQFSTYCANISSVNFGGFYPLRPQELNDSTLWCNPEVEPTHLHYD